MECPGNYNFFRAIPSIKFLSISNYLKLEENVKLKKKKKLRPPPPSDFIFDICHRDYDFEKIFKIC